MKDVASLLPGVPWVESPFFENTLAAQDFDDETRRIAVDLNRDGFAVFDFPDGDILEKAERIKKVLAASFDFESWKSSGAKTGMRVQDAWRINEDVRSIAANLTVLATLEKLYRRRPIPFQTLNFPVGTQQHFHSDSLHFSCVPERFMCGVWLALEDIDEDNGPLVYFPGSHKWPIFSNEQIGHNVTRQGTYSQVTFEPLWEALVKAHGVEPRRFTAKKGQALIWAANLMHGGAKQTSVDRTRWSQVTHYYFEDCAYYTPMASVPALGAFAYRTIVDVTTGEQVENRLMGEEVHKDDILRLALNSKQALRDFDPGMYLAANPDVASAGVDPLEHFREYGLREGRPLKPVLPA